MRVNKKHVYRLEYKSWQKMHERCKNTNSTQYKYYGGRGIAVCERWDNFDEFFLDMGPRPGVEFTLDRVNSNGNYSKENCRWASKKVQANNRKSNRLVTIAGKTKTLSQWCDESGIGYSTLKQRLNRGVSEHLLFFKGRIK